MQLLVRVAALGLILIAALVLAGDQATTGGRAAGRLMAVTVDDLPVALGGRHRAAQQLDITERLLATLAEHEVTAVGFVNGGKLEVDGTVDPARVGLLERWLAAGHELGNHTLTHPDLHRVPVADWLADAFAGERALRPLVEGHGRTLRWFRHPYLHTGRSVAIQEQTAAALAEHGYRVAPVTVDNGEWRYGAAYADAWNAGDEALSARLGASYVEYMFDVVHFWEEQTEVIVGRPIPHVLLVHAYALNADHLGTLLDRLTAENWHWTTLEAALEDPVYSRPVSGYTGPGGISWVHRWAITADVDRSVFAGEPEVPEWVRELGR